MSKITVTEEVEWTVTWQGGSCHAYRHGSGTRVLYHEDDINSTWPEAVREECRRVIQVNRPLAENETRSSSAILKTEIIGTMSVTDAGDLCITWPETKPGGLVVRKIWPREQLECLCVDRPERLAYLDKHAPRKREVLTDKELGSVVAASLHEAIKSHYQRDVEICARRWRPIEEWNGVNRTQENRQRAVFSDGWQILSGNYDATHFRILDLPKGGTP